MEMPVVTPSPVTLTVSDPVTALLTQALSVTNTILVLAGKVWDATPKEIQAERAGDWGKFVHNLSAPIIDAQNKLNSAMGVKG